MALRLSTCLRNVLDGGGSMRKAFEDALLMIYSGPAPASADDSPTGDLLARITYTGAVCADNAHSTQMVEALTVSAYADGNTNGCTINTDWSFSVTASSDTTSTIAAKLAALINQDPTVPAVAIAVAAIVYIMSKFAGEAIVVVATGSPTPPSGPAHTLANARVNSLHLAAPVLGVISKESAAWSHTAIKTGTAGYFRLVRTTDGLDSDTNYTDPRLQGDVSTSGAQLNLSNINLVSGATITVDTFAVTEPAA